MTRQDEQPEKKVSPVQARGFAGMQYVTDENMDEIFAEFGAAMDRLESGDYEEIEPEEFSGVS